MFDGSSVQICISHQQRARQILTKKNLKKMQSRVLTHSIVIKKYETRKTLITCVIQDIIENKWNYTISMMKTYKYKIIGNCTVSIT